MHLYVSEFLNGYTLNAIAFQYVHMYVESDFVIMYLADP